MVDHDDVLRFWFGDGREPYAVEAAVSRRWFEQSETFDQEVRDRFAEAIDAAVGGGLEEWTETPRGTLALVILLDQLTRNAHRGTPAMYAGDARAQALALAAIERGDDRRLRPIERTFLYMPLEHAEDRALQERSVEQFEALAAAAPEGSFVRSLPRWAHSHREVVARFGRFPHRNAILGRTSTSEEEAFLASDDPKF